MQEQTRGGQRRGRRRSALRDPRQLDLIEWLDAQPPPMLFANLPVMPAPRLNRKSRRAPYSRK